MPATTCPAGHASARVRDQQAAGLDDSDDALLPGGVDALGGAGNIRLAEVEEQRASSRKGTTGLDLVIRLVPDLAASERSLRGYGGRGRK